MSRKDYNNVKWSDHLYLDPSSPSGLRWNKEVRLGFNNSNLKHVIGDIAGTPLKRGNGKIKAWGISVGGIVYFGHRVIWNMTNGYIADDLVIDHIDGDVLNNNIQNLRLTTSLVNAQNTKMGSKNKSGTVGVFKSTNKYNQDYWRASWSNKDKRPRSKTFLIHKYGEAEAFRLACEYRTQQIALLNAQGANYTERHGTMS